MNADITVRSIYWDHDFKTPWTNFLNYAIEQELGGDWSLYRKAEYHMKIIMIREVLRNWNGKYEDGSRMVIFDDAPSHTAFLLRFS